MKAFDDMNRKLYVKNLLLPFLVAGTSVATAVPYQATGIKIGEVDDRSAIVWT